MQSRRSSGVPGPARHELRREHLLELLHQHRAQPLVLLVAAAGFGKSTLAATYARDSGGAVVWLSLQSPDRDSRRFFTRLAEAIEAGFDDPEAVPELRRGLREAAEGVGLARLLLADLAHAPTGFILVLDDFHLVGDAADVVGAVDMLIRDLSDGGQVVITAREAPALSMTRLIAAGAVFPLGAQDLRFSEEETRELRATLGGDSACDIQAEGWVAGILLGGAPRSLGFGGGSLLGTFVEREVLSRLSAAEQGWLEMLSVLDTITPAAADSMFGAGPWPSRLLGLAEHCPFLTPREDGSYRLHALVRETVLNRLRRSPDNRATHAWSVAGRLAEAAFDTALAVRAAQELGQLDAAIALVHRAALEAVQKGRWPAVLVTLELLPEVVRRRDPSLTLIEARALANTGRPEMAYRAAEDALQFGGRTGSVFVQISALVELATVTFNNDTTAAEDWLSAADHLLRRSELPTEQQRLLEGRALGVRGICATMRGDIGEARNAFENGVRLLSLVGPSRDLAMLQQNYGNFCERTGDYLGAQIALAAAAAYWRRAGDGNGRTLSQIVLGDMHLRLGNLEAAGGELNDGLATARSVGAVRLEAHATASLGQWHRANGRLVDAVKAFDEGLRLARENVERELLAETLVWRAEVALLQDDLPTARQLLASAQAESQVAGSNAGLASVDRALGRLHLVDGAGERATVHLAAALQRGGDSWGPDQRAETLYWLGTAYLKLGRAQVATGYLEQAIQVVDTANLPGLLAGPAAEDPQLLQHGRKVGLNPLILAEVERLSATRRPWTGVAATTAVSIVVENELPRLEVQLFGSFVMHRDGQLVANVNRKVDRARELLTLLILNPQGLPDESTAELMWPEMRRQRALHNLQMAAYSLRDDLGSKAAVRFGQHSYQLNPQLELIADVRAFETWLARSRGATGDALVQALSRAVDLYRGPLLAEAAWDWLEHVRRDYRDRYISAALQLADLVAHSDAARSNRLAEAVLAVAPETDIAYERVIQNARASGDRNAIRRLIKRYEQAATLFRFPIILQVTGEQRSSGVRAAH